MAFDARLIEAAEQLGEALAASGARVVTAESCTGGGLAYLLTEVPGSSRWFERGFVTYSNASKQEALGVPATILSSHGAVSGPCVEAMVSGALAHSRSDVAIAISGVAGPGGGSPEKPVGTVWIGYGWRSERPQSCCLHLPGDRRQVRLATIEAAVTILAELADAGV
ncbi:MAG: CinA family protein [Halothiobacillaceae bacterium]